MKLNSYPETDSLYIDLIDRTSVKSRPDLVMGRGAAPHQQAYRGALAHHPRSTA